MSLEKLIEACIQKNPKAEKEFYYKYYEKLYRLAYFNVKNSDIALEIVNDGFLTIFNKLHTITELATFEKWMRTIIINKCIDHHRLKKRLFVDIEDATVHAIPSSIDEDFEVSNNTVELILKDLSDMERVVMVLHILEDYSHKEIAEVLNISIENSRQIVHRSKSKLQRRKELNGR